MRITIVLLVVLASCSSNDKKEANKDAFIDIHQFFTDQVEHLTNSDVAVFKRTRMDSITNSDSFVSPDWSQELFAFIELDIKPAVWKTDFKRVHTHDDPNETSLVYETTNPNQKVKSFKIKEEDGKIQRFSAEIIEKGKISSSVTALSYTKNVGYTMSVERNTKIMGNESYQIVGQFFKNNNQNKK